MKVTPNFILLTILYLAVCVLLVILGGASVEYFFSEENIDNRNFCIDRNHNESFMVDFEGDPHRLIGCEDRDCDWITPDQERYIGLCDWLGPVWFAMVLGIGGPLFAFLGIFIVITTYIEIFREMLNGV